MFNDPVNFVDPNGLFVSTTEGAEALLYAANNSTIAVEGCLFFPCLSADVGMLFGGEVNETQMNIEPGSLGGGFEICISPPSSSSEGATCPSDDAVDYFNIEIGKYAGVSFKEDGTVCIGLGVGWALPIGVGADVGNF